MAESETNTYINNQYDIHDSIQSWYLPETGIYSSKHPYIHLPNDPLLDIVSHIFSYTHNGTYAYIDPLTGSSVKYSELFPLVKSTAVGLKKVGVSKGDVVLILLPNSIHLPVLFLGVLYIGGIIVPMNPQSTFIEVKKQTVGLNVSLCFTLGENATKFRALGLKVIQVDGTEHDGRFNEFLNLIYNNMGVSSPRGEINQNDTAAILFSSGTTGVSKGVVLTHRNFISMVELFVRFEASQYKEMSWENVYLDVLPMFHIYGISLFVFGLISLGTSVVVMNKFEIDEVVKAIERFKVTHFAVVPSTLVMLTKKVKCLGSNASFASLKQVSCGAAPSTTKIISDFLDAFPGVDFIQGYGMTETTAVATRGFNVTGHVHKYTSVGLLAPNTEAKVVGLNTTDSSLPPGKTGELLLRGPGIMKGYYNNVEATRLTIEKDGWLHTGDLAYFDNDGYLYIVDRLKEMIKYKGYQIAPADLEAILICHPDILDVAVAPVSDDLAGEIPVAFVVRRPGSLLCRDEVLKYVAKKVSPYKKVRQVVFVNSLPRSPTGKVLRRQLKDSLICKL